MGSVLVDKEPCSLFFFFSFYVVKSKGILYPLLQPGRKVLSMNNNDLLRRGIIQPVSVQSPQIPHLLYGDDILHFLFLGSFKEECSSHKKNLQPRCQAAVGQVLDLRKSHLFVGKCSLSLKRSIIQTLDIPAAPLLSCYLGAPLFIGSLKRAMFSHVLDDIHKMLTGWSSKVLYLAGRLVL